MVKRNTSLVVKTALLWLFLCLVSGAPIVISAPNADVNLAITKSDSVDPVVAGESLTYLFSISNAGPSAATGVAITDALPGGVTYTSASSGCTYNADTRTVRCGLGEVGAGSATNATIQVRVDPATTGTLLNQAVVSTLDTDTNPSNNNAQTTTTVTTSSDLRLTMTAPSSVIAGGLITYTLTISNSGSSDARGVELQADFPGGTSYASSSIPCTLRGHRVTCNVGVVAADTNTIVTITLLVDAGKTGTVTNQTQVSTSTTDPITTNNSATLTTPVVIASDITISKNGVPDAIPPGGLLTYTITTHNNGLSNAQGVAFSDTLPTRVAFQSYTATKGTCSGTTTITCAPGSMIPGETVTVTLVGQVGTSASPGTITNTVSVLSTSPDLNQANNSASERTSIAAPDEIADLQIIKDDLIDPVRAGEALTYTITVNNTGPASATGVVVTDTLPVSVTLSTISASQGTCTETVCSLGTISATHSAMITLTVNVDPAATGVITNTATVSTIDDDPVPGNNTALETTTIINGDADLQVAKHDLIDPIRAGNVLTYTIIVSNTGPSNASGVVMTDTLPISAALSSISTSQGTCDGIICTLGTISANSSATITMSVNVYPTVTGVITNTARVSANEADPVAGNNTVHETTTIINETANLQISKHDLIDPVRAGEMLTYTITVSNTGPAIATGVVVTDTLPASVTLSSIEPSQGSCTETICELGTIIATHSAIITMTVRVDPTATGVITNQASVSANEDDLIPENNTVQEATTILPGPVDLLIAKHDLNDPVRAGETLTYTITISNTGPSNASGVVVTDTLPTSVTIQSAIASQGSCDLTRCTLGDLALNNRASITMTVMVNPSTTGVITNSVTVSANEVDPVMGNNSAQERTTIIRAADLNIEKTGTPEPVFAGRSLAYRLEVSNYGPSRAEGVHVVDDLPEEVSFVSAPAGCTHSNGSVDCSLGGMAPGASLVVTITVNVDLSATGLVSNIASLTSTTTDPVHTNDQSEWITTILAPDNQIPTVSWLQPVLNGERINVGCQTLRLQVSATDNLAVQHVRFYRWDPYYGPTGGYVDIGYDTSSPYQWDLNTCSLATTWNQVFAQSQDTYGNQSVRQFIWIYRYVMFLPAIIR